MPQIAQELRAWARVRLNRERADLDPQDLAYALNADLFLEEGTIRIRRGSSQVYGSPLTDLTVRGVVRFNTTRYQVAGTTLYRGGVSALTGLHSGLITTLQPHRPLNDTTTWVFIADRSAMKKDNGTTLYPWGIVANTSTLAVYGGPTGSLTGTYNAKVTGCRFDGTAVAHEGNPCAAATTSATLTAQSLAIADITPPAEADADGLGIYRTVAGGATYLRDARVDLTAADGLTDYTYVHPWEVQDLPAGAAGLQYQVGHLASGYRGTQTWEPRGTGDGEDASGYSGTYPWEKSYAYVATQTVKYGYISTLADAALGSLLETDNDAPPACSFVSAPYQDRAWLCQDPLYPHYAWHAKRHRPESVPTSNYVEIGTPEDPLRCLLPTGGVLLALTRDKKYRIQGSGDTFMALESPSKRGTVGTFTACVGEEGVYFVARDGIFRTTGFSPDEQLAESILPIFQDESKNGLLPINWTYASTFSLAIWGNRLYFSYADTSSTTPNMVAVNKLGTDRWNFYQYPTGLASLFYERDTGSLTAGGHDGHVYLLETGTDDAGTSITLTADTKDLGHVTQDSPTGVLARHLFLFTQTDGEPDGGTITETVYVDGTALSPTYSLTVSRRPTRSRLPATAQGYRWRKRWTYTGSGAVRIYGTSVIAEPLAGA